ncbi:MAG: hypothetical protein JW995_13910 [Melioribacteraceae bacterium]|nr:hypothetical protein [Melioribacteraceae bacterium]
MFIRLESADSQTGGGSGIKYEFHITKSLREKYGVDDELFSITGNVVLADFTAVRKFVNKLNAVRPVENHVRYGEVNGAALLDEIYHFVLREYEERENPGVFSSAVKHVEAKLGEDKLRKLLFDFIELFPPVEVYKGKSSAFDYLNSIQGKKSNIEITLEEIILLHFANINPAGNRLKELFDDNYFSDKKLYDSTITELDAFFKTQKSFGPDNQDIFALLRTPILSNPDNLWDQLEFIRKKWGIILKDNFTGRLLLSKDLMKEDIKFESFGAGGGRPPVPVPVYKGRIAGADDFVIGKSLYKYAEEAEQDYDEPEQFTPDIHWMPRVVLIAKNAYVWLNQLSKKYGREINHLDQVPDEELDLLAKWNFTGLWLIGLWERSSASKRIKHIMGNTDAVASAYSLYDYTVANDLGGDVAYDNLNRRAKKRGIRLASDMVPNHTGIFSNWVINHPDYFIQLPHPPFPNYSFSGENLSQDPHVEIRIEDGYFSHHDAAVVFQRVDKRYNDVRYIYHGNDGTNMPWNDTAQLDMLKNEVREAVISKIFEVARKFSIIRFDAAMTLTKRHFSRLWYPQPGKGGDIPSRADNAMTREQFDQLFPEEFWREVVDRINREMPETLLLAEAFWLMEGYFVRTLGMHRVYNSAFMHMMMKEENEKYRDLITNTLEFEPEILKRYVNFMSNPDEETAIKQFGTDDKYFGVLTLMVTLPGLPMFAHGQIEGYTEKYGMEYKRAYYNELPKDWLVKRHEREIFPLTKKRYLFAEVTDFWFYDCIDEYGNINENVFAFTNSFKDEKALVIYNNKYDRAYGKINVSTPKLVPNSRNEKSAKSITLIEALGIKGDDGYFYKCRDMISGLEYLLKGTEMVTGGYYVNLEGFKHKVFTGFKELYDDKGDYDKLYNKLHGQGAEDIDISMRKLKLSHVHELFENIFRQSYLNDLVDRLITDINEEADVEEEIKEVTEKYYLLHNEIKRVLGRNHKDEVVIEGFAGQLKQIKKINLALILNFSPATHHEYTSLNKSIVISEESNYNENILVMLLYMVITELHKIYDEDENRMSIIDELLLIYPVNKILKRLGRGDIGVERELSLLKVLLNYTDKLFDVEKGPVNIFNIKSESDIQNFISIFKQELIEQLLMDEDVHSFLLVNHYEGIWYYSKERFEELVDWLLSIALLNFMNYTNEYKFDAAEFGKKVYNLKPNRDINLDELNSELIEDFIKKANMIGDYLKDNSERSGYDLDILRQILINKEK